MNPSTELDQPCGSKHCPGCGHKLQGKPVWDWLGLPAGVKFDPTDQELIEHLEAKAEEAKDIKSHPLIDEFILTIKGEDGICYTHPEKLPGVSRDGLSRHFFHRPSKAYTTGTRKRRKIQTECDLQGGETRWHKTGKTRPVMVNGKPKGYKKILVLYTNFGKNRKPEKTNWVMHQYHLGQHEEEKEGELVVSKIFYQTQPRQCKWSDRTATTVGISSGSCSYLKEQVIPVRDDLSVALSSYAGAMDIRRLKSHPFVYTPFRTSFGQVGIGEASTWDASAQSTFDEPRDHPQPHDHRYHHDDHHYQQQQHQIATAAAFHISRPSHPISTIISPPPLHHASFILDEDSFHISRIMLQNFESSQESSINNPQVAEWMKYSSFWPDPDNQDHHG